MVKNYHPNLFLNYRRRNTLHNSVGVCLRGCIKIADYIFNNERDNVCRFYDRKNDLTILRVLRLFYGFTNSILYT